MFQLRRIDMFILPERDGVRAEHWQREREGGGERGGERGEREYVGGWVVK